MSSIPSPSSRTIYPMTISLSDVVAVVSLVLTILGLVIGIIIGWHSSEPFRRATQNSITFVRIRIIQQHFFFSTYVPALILLLAILHTLDYLSVSTALGTYAIWITAWTFVLRRRSRNLSTVASCLLGWEEREAGANGLQHVFYSDGKTQLVPFQDYIVRRTDVKERQYYMYFRIRDDIVQHFRDAPSVIIGVEFFDFSEPEFHGHAFDLQYDSTDMTDPRPSFKHSSAIAFENTGTWKLKTVEIRDGSFSRSQQGIADFRVNCQLRPARHKTLYDLYVRRIVAIALNE
jgi:hypothetical protein